jgi:hypothetical protein
MAEVCPREIIFFFFSLAKKRKSYRIIRNQMDWRISSGSFTFHRIEGAICSARLRGNFYRWSRQVSDLL